MFRPGETVLVAVSGGPDSVCLLDLLFRLREALGIRLCVAHLNHRLRGQASEADARFVARLSKKMDLPCEVGVCDVGALSRAEGRSPEDGARQARLRFLEEARRRVGASRIALGHTQSDQAETVLLRLLRGSGRGGLGAMRPVRDGVWVRPLLSVSREEVGRYLALRGLPFRRDATNRDVRFTRNRIRRDLLPRLRRDYNPDVEGVLARTASVLAEEEAWLEGVVQRAFVRARRPSPPGKIVLDVQRVLGYHLALQRRVIRRALAEAGCRGDALSFEVVDRVLSALNCPARTLRVSAEVGVRRASDALIFARPTPAFETPVRIPGRTAVPALGVVLTVCIHPASEVRASLRGAGPDEVFADLRAFAQGATIRNARKGDRFQPLGMAGTKRVSDLLADAKVPRLLRDSVPVLTGSGAIVWVVGHRLAHAARVTGQTRQVVHIQVKKRSKDIFYE
ncbi:MAG: tRNA lysidine(34) synthetase TilS [Candidatus Handelsmanbacteria bacterium RIFCSPLOWO2_12_FULL_64_10]|uniref:tRNA(Ile)-lysidine synthase n=1 Tax=Handelsmanbacteria sp. (strain RIFCSPLOWO2_12_FULL_64_10) TaxID=1817868 RepID=A0A1F6C9X6_HANXR|nr:MAG: tRNA lysidine(34) synthetase TilS [Candidatus Handelsmanbacteria bacterium RIFCSPLOWO2_12_FULL_64_10]